MLFARAPWGEIKLESEKGLKGFSSILKWLQFFPPKKTLFWWTLRVDCELSVFVDISR